MIRFFFYILIIICLLISENVFSASIIAPPDSLSGANLSKANALLKEGKYDAAVLAFRSYLTDDSTSYDALFGLARALAFSGEHDLSIEVYSRLIFIYPNDPDAHLGRGRVYAWKQQFEAAVKDLRYVTDHFPNYLDAWSALSDLYAWWGKYREATDGISRIIQAEPHVPDHYVKRAKVFRLNRQFSMARGDLFKALDLGGDKKTIDRQLQQLARIPEPTLWSTTLEYDYLTYSDNRDKGHTLSTSFKREFEPGTLILKVLRTRRFGNWDQALVLDSYIDIWLGAYANLTYQQSVNRKFLPSNTVRLEIYQGFLHGWEVSGSYGHMNFPTTKVDLYSLLTAKYAGPWYIRTRVLWVPLSNKPSLSYTLSVRRYLGNVDDFIDAHYGWSTVQENINSIEDLSRIQTQSLLIRIEKTLLKDIIFLFQYSLRAEKDSYSTQAISLGTIYRW